jgi:hypothetical protein
MQPIVIGKQQLFHPHSLIDSKLCTWLFRAYGFQFEKDSTTIGCSAIKVQGGTGALALPIFCQEIQTQCQLCAGIVILVNIARQQCHLFVRKREHCIGNWNDV